MTQLMDRALCTTAPTDVSQIAARVGFTLPVFIAPKLQETIYAVPQGYWHETTDGRLIEVLQAALTTIASTPTEDPYVDIRFTARMANQANESAHVHLTIKLVASYDLAPWLEELSITLSPASPVTPPIPQPTDPLPVALELAIKAYQGRPSKENAHEYIPLWAAPLVPALYAQDGMGAEALVYLKYFTPDSSWTWYVLEGCAIIETDSGSVEEVSLSELDQDLCEMWYARRGGTVQSTRGQNPMPPLSKQSDSSGQIAGELRSHERRQEPQLDRRDHGEPRLCLCEKAGPPNGSKERLCKESQPGVGDDHGALSRKRRTGSSQERELHGRRSGKLGADDVIRPCAASQQNQSTKIKVLDVMCFGLVEGFDLELGYFSLKEITQARGKLGLRIERDLWFCPRTLGELRESL